MSHNDLQPWKLLSAEDVSPSAWFPMEKRSYELPDGAVVEDFYVTTLADVAHVVATDSNGLFFVIKMYKPGIDAVMLQWPAGRFEEAKHTDMHDLAQKELLEETGIETSRDTLEHLGTLGVMTTKATEKSYIYLARAVEPTCPQKLDPHEDIQLQRMTHQAIDQAILDGSFWDATALGVWQLVKIQRPELFS